MQLGLKSVTNEISTTAQHNTRSGAEPAEGQQFGHTHDSSRRVLTSVRFAGDAVAIVEQILQVRDAAVVDDAEPEHRFDLLPPVHPLLQIVRHVVERVARLDDAPVDVVDAFAVRRHERTDQAGALLAQLLARFPRLLELLLRHDALADVVLVLQLVRQLQPALQPLRRRPAVVVDLHLRPVQLGPQHLDLLLQLLQLQVGAGGGQGRRLAEAPLEIHLFLAHVLLLDPGLFQLLRARHKVENALQTGGGLARRDWCSPSYLLHLFQGDFRLQQTLHILRHAADVYFGALVLMIRIPAADDGRQKERDEQQIFPPGSSF